jgi:hypothetical protein
LVLVVGGLASIATSRIAQEWTLNDEQLLPAGVIDQTDSITYPIRVEIRGPGPFTSLNGLAQATVQIDARSAPTTSTAVTVRLRSTTHPEIPVDEESILFDSDSVHEIVVAFPSWNGCQNDACAENFELEVMRLETPTPTIYDITGSIEIDANGSGETPPDGTSLTVTIGPPQ